MKVVPHKSYSVLAKVYFFYLFVNITFTKTRNPYRQEKLMVKSRNCSLALSILIGRTFSFEQN